jgi:hypothetical protein
MSRLRDILFALALILVAMLIVLYQVDKVSKRIDSQLRAAETAAQVQQGGQRAE